MTKEQIEEMLNKEGLTDDQKKAVRTIDKDLEIVACAGAGKTKTITLRIINLIAHGVKPENIVAITFTRKAAAEMKTRIYKAGEKYLGNTIGFAGMYIGTIDAFCLKMLQEYVPAYAKFSVLDEVQTRIFIERFLRSREADDPTGLRGSVIDMAPNLRKTGKFAKKLEIYTGLMSMLNNCYYDEECRDNWSEEIKKRLGKFNSCLRENKFFDYSSLIKEMIEFLDPHSEQNGGEISDRAKKIFDRVKYLTIDEYQDSNPPQEHLAQLFHEHGTNLCVVGDADQTIYQFRGSDESNILGFENKYAAVKINLDQDFRSTEAVVDIARKSISADHKNDPGYIEMKKGIVPGSMLKDEEDDTVYAVFDNYDEEADFITKRIKELIDNGIPPREIAVLFRNRRKLYFGEIKTDFQLKLAEKLKAAKIKYVVEGMNNLSATPEYKAGQELFRFIDETYFSEEFVNQAEVRMSDERVLKRAFCEIGTAYQNSELINGIDKAIEELKGRSWREIRFGHEFNMQQIFQDFIGHMEFVESDSDDAITVMYNLGKFSKVIADFELLFFKGSAKFKSHRFMYHLKNVADGLYPEGEEDNAYIRGNAVRLMTIHQSKGLEFTAVFIPAMVQSIFPGESFDPKDKIYSPIDALDKSERNSAANCVPNYSGYQSGIDKERREHDERKVFYVAVTRAKKYLFLTYSHSYGKYYDLKLGKIIPLEEAESDFLLEIKKSDYIHQYRENHEYTKNCLPPMIEEPIPMVLNFSLLSNYFDCPYRFKLSNFYGFVQPYKPEQGFGKMLHEIMMHIHNTWIESKKLSKTDIDKIAEDALYLPFASKPELDNSLKSARKCAHAYVKQNEKDADKMIASELDINIEMGDGVSVNGRIDLVRKIDDGGDDKVAIVDLKSAGKDSEQCLNAEQLKIYALGYRQMTGQNADYLMIYNLDAPDGSRNAGKEIQQEMLIEVQDRIKEAADCIRKSELPRKEGDRCGNCYVRGLCKVTRGE